MKHHSYDIPTAATFVGDIPVTIDLSTYLQVAQISLFAYLWQQVLFYSAVVIATYNLVDCWPQNKGS